MNSNEGLPISTSFDTTVDDEDSEALDIESFMSNMNRFGEASNYKHSESESGGASRNSVNQDESLSTPKQQCRASDEESACLPDESFLLSLAIDKRRLGRLSLDSRGISDSKIKKIKKVIAEGEKSSTDYKTRQFILDCAKLAKKHMPKLLATRVDQALAASVIRQYSTGKSRTGQIFSILDIDDEDIEEATNVQPSHLEQKEIKKYTLKIMSEHFSKIKEEKNRLKEMFGVHALSTGGAGLLSAKAEKLVREHASLQEQMSQRCEKLRNCAQMMEEWGWTTVERELQATSLNCLRDKAKYLFARTSILKKRLEQNVDVAARNAQGDALKEKVEEELAELRALQQKLVEYKHCENTSPAYKFMIAEYAKRKRISRHKKETLRLLDNTDSDCSFS